MSNLALVPQSTSWAPTQHLLNQTATTPAEREHAQIIVHHRAPDLYSMIFGA